MESRTNHTQNKRRIDTDWDNAWKEDMMQWEKEIMEECRSVAMTLHMPFTESTQILIYNAILKTEAHMSRCKFIENAPKATGEDKGA